MGDRFCKNCGAKILENAEFCGNCGAKLTETDVEFKERGTIGMFDENNRSNDLENSLNGDVLNNAFYSQPMQPPPKKKNTGLIVGIVATVLLVLIFVGQSAEKIAQKYDSSDEISEYISDNSDATKTNKESEEVVTKFEIGTVTNDTYENKYLGIKCKLDGWTYLDREQLMENTNQTNDFMVDNIDDEELLKTFENFENFCDMMATNVDGYTNVNIMVQKTPEAYNSVSEEIVISGIVSELPNYYESMGFTVNQCEYTEINVNGTKKQAIYSNFDMYGTNIHTLQFIQIKPKHYATVSITGASKEECLYVCNSIYFN